MLHVVNCEFQSLRNNNLVVFQLCTHSCVSMVNAYGRLMITRRKCIVQLKIRIVIKCHVCNRNNTFLGYYTTAFNVGNIGGTAVVNNAIGGTSDILAAILLVVLLKKFNRRNTMAFFLATFGCLSLVSPPIRQG